jgi:hypothetical protein
MPMAQSDTHWSADKLGTCSPNLGAAGCAVTSEAMVFNFYQVSVSSSKGTGMTPAILNAWLTDNNYYAPGNPKPSCDISWAKVPAGITYGGSDLSVTHLNSELAAGRPVIAQVTSTQTSMHFVVITGQDNNTYDINDPQKGSKTDLNHGDWGVYTVVAYQYFSKSGAQQVTTPPATPSNMSATALSSSSIRFNWQDNSSNETSFDVYRWSGSAWAKAASPAANSTSWTDTGLTASTYYYYYVCSRNSAGAGCTSTYTYAQTQSKAQQVTPPATPSNLTLTPLSTSSIRVNWQDTSNNETSFDVYRWSGSAWAKAASPAANSTSWTDTGLTASTYYYYYVCSRNSAGANCTSYTSAKTLAPAVTAPAAPSNMSATALSTSSIRVNWQRNATNETSFDVYRWTGSTWAKIADASAGSTNWTDNGLSASTTYYYVICPRNSAGANCSSNYAQATTQAKATTQTQNQQNQNQGHADVIVDDTSGGFARAGTSSFWHETSGGYNNHFWWTYTNKSGVDDRATWTPTLSASGRWEVYVYIPNQNGTTTNARYRVDHQGSSTTVCINQNSYNNAWVSLGTYSFNADSSTHVFLGDETYEASAHQIAFDAVKWVWRGN